MRNVDFKSAPKECSGCHEDPHGGQFVPNGVNPECSSCHENSRWRPSLFDHEKRTSFSLQGAHKDVPCGQCHKQIQLVEGNKVLFYKPTPKIEGQRIDLPSFPKLTALLGTLGLITVGTLFSAMAVNTRGREAILPLLVMPVSIPVMIAAVKVTQSAFAGGWAEGTGPWVLLMVAYDALFLLVAIATFPYVTEG